MICGRLQITRMTTHYFLLSESTGASQDVRTHAMSLSMMPDMRTEARDWQNYGPQETTRLQYCTGFPEDDANS